MSAVCLICLKQASVYCSNDEAFLCSACDASCHASALASRHSRTPVCGLCNRKASTVYCRNDEAFLCGECDASAHANPLAARHMRIPAAEGPHNSNNNAQQAANQQQQTPADCVSESADVPAAEPAAPATAMGSIVPPAVELPTNQVMDKDALAKAFGKEMEVRADCCGSVVCWIVQGGQRQQAVRLRQLCSCPCCAGLLSPAQATHALLPSTCLHLPQPKHTTTTTGLCYGQQLAGQAGHGL